MTDPVIAPSFPEQLEQAVEHVREMLPLDQCSGCADVAALLTRAAALARAAEKVTTFDPIEADFDNQVNYCQFCRVIYGMDVAFEHEDDCAWSTLRALVLSEGSGE